jgi:hypothetical protein
MKENFRRIKFLSLKIHGGRRTMKKQSVVLLAAFLVCGVTGTAHATAVYLSDLAPDGSGYLDVEQPIGSNYCWACASANMLAYSGWDGGFPSNGAIFSEFTSHWTNDFGNPYYAINWWFDGTNDSPPSPGWSQVTTPGGGYYSEALFNAYNGYGEIGFPSYPDSIPVVDWVQYNLDNNRVFSMLLGTEEGGIHWLTGWGYEEDPAGDIVGVYFTDSLDGITQLLYSPLTQTGDLFYLSTYTEDWHVLAMDSLGYNINDIPPNQTEQFPEPATLLLTGLGLAGIGFARKKKLS